MSLTIQVLREEHDQLLQFVNGLRRQCIRLMEDNEFDSAAFEAAVDFIKNFADKRHHQKEEDILFKAMLEQLGKIAENLIKYGMFVEHNMARLYVMELEKAVNAYKKEPTAENKLDIIGNAMSYCYLLERHALKENEVVYPYAEKNLSKEVMDSLDVLTETYEKKFINKNK